MATFRPLPLPSIPISFPHHLHHGKQEYVVESHLSPDLACAFRQVLDFIAAEMAGG